MPSEFGSLGSGRNLHIVNSDTQANPLEIDYTFDWIYQRAVVITSGTALTDFQVSLTIDTATLITSGKMQSLGQDIRIADSDGTTLLPFWVENINTATTRIWTKVPSIPNGTKTIYLYYGNPNAPDAQSGANTFIDFSDFNDFTGWTQQAGTWTISNSILTAPNNANNYLRRNTTITETSYRVEAKVDGSGNFYHGILIAEANNPMVNSAALTSFCHINDTVQGSYNWSTFKSASFNVIDGTYNILGLLVLSGNNKAYASKLDRTGLSETASFQNTVGTGNYWGLFNNPDGTQYLVDWILVRKYTATEPSCVVGSESSAIGLGSIVKNILTVENSTGSVIIGDSDTVEACAILEIKSTNKGLLLPRMTTVQRDAIASPQEGLLIYNTTTKVVNFYNGTTWGAI